MFALPPYHGAAYVLRAESSKDSASWLLSYDGKSTNQVRWDSRLPGLLRRSLPHVHADFYDPKKILPDNALVALSGPPKPVQVESRRYVTLAASVPGVGELKGLLWVDTNAQKPSAIFAALNQDAAKNDEASLALYTRDTRWLQSLPPQFLRSLQAWLSKVKINNITSLTIEDNSGHPIPLSVEIVEESFQPQVN